MKQKLLGLMLPLAVCAGLQAATQPTTHDYTQYVNPFIGTGGVGTGVQAIITVIRFLLASDRCTLAARV